MHPSAWAEDQNAVIPEWVYCRVCDLLERARRQPEHADADGHPLPGWRLELRLNPSLNGGADD